MFLIVFYISYVHLGFMLHLLLFNERLLHYLSIMCVTMMCLVFAWVCAPSSIYFCLWRSNLWWALIPPVAFSFTTCVIMGGDLEETPLTRGGTVYNSKARHYHVVSRRKEGHPGGAEGSVGGLWGSCREEKRQIPATCPRLPGQGVDNMADEGGSRAQSVWNLLTKVGLRGHLRKAAVRRLGAASERASRWLWHKRKGTSWTPGGEGQCPGLSLLTRQLEGVGVKGRNTQRRLGTTWRPLFQAKASSIRNRCMWAS